MKGEEERIEIGAEGKLGRQEEERKNGRSDGRGIGDV